MKLCDITHMFYYFLLWRRAVFILLNTGCKEQCVKKNMVSCTQHSFGHISFYALVKCIRLTRNHKSDKMMKQGMRNNHITDVKYWNTNLQETYPDITCYNIVSIIIWYMVSQKPPHRQYEMKYIVPNNLTILQISNNPNTHLQENQI